MSLWDARAWPQLVGRWSLACALLASALALGAIHTPILGVTALFVGASATMLWFHAEPARPRTPATLLLGIGCLLILYTALQAAPLPASILRAIAPSNAELWARSLSPLRLDGPSTVSLSLDPLATRVEVLRGVTYVAGFLAALQLSKRREGTVFCIAAIVASAVIVAVSALAHPIVGAERVFGIYKPASVVDLRHIAPILNANALAAYLNIGFLLALGEGLCRTPFIPRPILLAIAGVLAATQFWVGSRAGIVTLVLGALFVGLSSRRLFRKERSIPTSTFGAALLLSLVGIGMCVLSTSDGAWDEIADRDISKLSLFSHVARMLRPHGVLGVGRGAFESTFPRFREGVGHLVYTHPENLPLQWASEWGVPIAILALGGIAWSLRPSVWLARRHPCVGAWVALGAAFVHNLADLNSEFPAVMLALSVCAGVVVGGTDLGSFRRLDAWAKAPRVVAGAAAAATASALLLAGPSLGNDLYADRERLRVAALDRTSREAFHELARHAMERHPAEPYLPFAGALRASLTRDESIVPWAARTLELSPIHGPAHLLLARSFFRRSPAQARLEYRYALMQAPKLLNQVVPEGVLLVNGVAQARELIPTGANAFSVTNALADRLGERLPATQTQLDEDVLAQGEGASRAIARRARALHADVVDDVTPWCAETERSRCIEAAMHAIKELQRVHPFKCEGFELESNLLALDGSLERASAVLEDAVDRVEDRVTCRTALVQLALRARDEPRITRQIDALARESCSDDDECATRLLRAGRIEMDRRKLSRAFDFFRKAHARYPARDDVLIAKASAASQLGLHAEAAADYAELVKRQPQNERWANALAQERQASMPRAPILRP